jgi:hypothetical protein
MENLSDFDRANIKRNEYYIKELQGEKQEHLDRVKEIDSMIADYSRRNRQVKNREVI